MAAPPPLPDHARAEHSSLVAQKGHLTRAMKLASGCIPDDRRTVQVTMAAALRAALQEVEKQHGLVVAKYEALTATFVRGDEEYAAHASRVQDKVDSTFIDLRRNILEVLNIAEANVSGSNVPRRPGGNADERHKPRVQEALRPKHALSLQFKPAECRAWLDKFEAYYTLSELQTHDVKIQQSFLYGCLAADLTAKLRDGTDETTPIYGANGCIDRLKAEFRQRYPLHLRRYDFFKSEQSAQQRFSDWTAKLSELGADADIQGIGPNEVYLHRWISGCSDDKLRERFLKEEAPTLARFQAIVHSYEASQSTLKAMNKGSSAKQASAVKKQRGRSVSRKRDSKANAASARDVICFTCGIKGHKTPACKKDRSAMQCEDCGQDGHNKAGCAARKKAASNKSRPRGRSQARGGGDAQSASPSPSRPAFRGANANSVVCSSQAVADMPTPSFFCEFATLHKSGNRRVEFSCECIPDTGATRSVISTRIVNRHNVRIRPSSTVLRAADGRQMDVAGEVSLRVTFRGFSTVVDGLVSSDLSADVLMSWHDLAALRVIPEGFPTAVASVASGDAGTHDALNGADQEQLDSLREEMLNRFPTVFSDQLDSSKVISGGKMRIELDPVKVKEVKPMHAYTARQVPIHLKEAADELIARLIKDGIIERVTKPTTWVSHAHIVGKPGGGARLTADLKQLNKCVKRPVHPFMSTKDILQNLDATSKVYAKYDATSGYHQVELDEESRDLTTFLLPSGRYRYARMPMGLVSSGDVWCQRSDQAFEGHRGTLKIVDDGITGGRDIAELRERLVKVFESCKKHSLTLSRKKFQIGREVKFAGHVIGADGVKPDPDKVKALRDFPAPKSVSELRSFLGLANQLGNFIPDLAHVTLPMRALLKSSSAWQWLHEQQRSFEKTKDILTGPLLVKPFDISLPSEIYCDASRLHGLGFMLLQREPDGKHRLISCGSRSVTPTEGRYATTELEALGVHYAITQCRFYLKGAEHFDVFTDHRALVGMFDKPLPELTNQRVMRYRERLQEFNFTITWVKGKTHFMADALSRSPLLEGALDEEGESDPTVETLCSLIASSQPSLNLLVKSIDKEYREIVDAVRAGKNPQKLHCQHPARPYANVWDELSLSDDSAECLILLGGLRVLVPRDARPQILDLLHRGHCGISKSRQNAKSLYFWHGMSNSIKQKVNSCAECQEKLPSQVKEECVEQDRRDLFPMSDVATDIFHLAGQNYLVMVDRYSGFPWCKQLRSSSTEAVTMVLETWFSDWGFPLRLRSDGGPCFRESFDEFCSEYGIVHELSSSYFPQSNGLSENCVKSMKHLLSKCKSTGEKFHLALLEWRNTRRQDGTSPSSLFMCRRQRTLLPGHPDLYVTLAPEEQEKQRNARFASMDKTLSNFDAGAVPARDSFSAGDKVFIQDPKSGKWDRQGVIRESRSHGRSYTVEPEGGRVKLLNRRFLRPVPVDFAAAVSTKGILKSAGAAGSGRSIRFRLPDGTVLPSARDVPAAVKARRLYESLSPSSTWAVVAARTKRLPQTSSVETSSAARVTSTSSSCTPVPLKPVWAPSSFVRSSSQSLATFCGSSDGASHGSGPPRPAKCTRRDCGQAATLAATAVATREVSPGATLPTASPCQPCPPTSLALPTVGCVPLSPPFPACIGSPTATTATVTSTSCWPSRRRQLSSFESFCRLAVPGPGPPVGENVMVLPGFMTKMKPE